MATLRKELGRKREKIKLNIYAKKISFLRIVTIYFCAQLFCRGNGDATAPGFEPGTLGSIGEGTTTAPHVSRARISVFRAWDGVYTAPPRGKEVWDMFRESDFFMKLRSAPLLAITQQQQNVPYFLFSWAGSSIGGDTAKRVRAEKGKNKNEHLR